MERGHSAKNTSSNGSLNAITPNPADSNGQITRSRDGCTPDRAASSSSLRAANIQSNSPSAGSNSVRRSRDSLNSIQSTKTATPPPPSVPNKDDKMLQILQKEFTSLRELVTCNICYDLLYEPFTTACGHTYCYNCLCKSFMSTKSRACPECRTFLRHAPAPAYLVRKLTHSVFQHQELLPGEETLEEHRERRDAQAQEVQQDKNNADPRRGGLFKGFFKSQRLRLRPVRDAEDGVDRCPYCNWELEGDMCERCGLPFDENGTGDWDDGWGIPAAFSDVDLTNTELSSTDSDVGMDLDLDLDGPLGYHFYDTDTTDWYDQDPELDAEDLEHYPIDAWRPPYPSNVAARRPAAHSAAGSRRHSYSQSLASDMTDSQMGTLAEEDENEDEEDEDGDSSMQDFIDDDDEIDDLSSSRSGTSVSETTPLQSSTQQRWFSASEVAEGDEEGENDEEDNHDDDDSPVVHGRGQLASQHRGSNTTPLSTEVESHGVESGYRGTSNTSATGGPSEDDEDEEDEGPVRPVRRRRLQSAMTSTSRGNNGDGEGSDGTTVGLAQTTNPNRRTTSRGSLTPSADRIHASASVNPQVNARQHRQGLRRRSSVLSQTSLHYEDNDADDEDHVQFPDPVPMRRPLRSQSSIIRLGVSVQRVPSAAQSNHDFNVSTGQYPSDGTDDSGETIPTSGSSRRHREIDDSIRFAYSQHRTIAEDDDVNALDAGTSELRLLAGTPQSSIRRRMINPSAATHRSGFASPANVPPRTVMVPGRLRTPAADQRHVQPRPNIERSISASNRIAARDAQLAAISNMHDYGTVTATQILPAAGRAANSTPLNISTAPSSFTTLGHATARPESRVGYRATTPHRRGSGVSAGFSLPAGTAPTNPQPRTNNPFRNPLGNSAQRLGVIRPQNSFQRLMDGIESPISTMRTRPSRPQLRDQSSTATLRARNSAHRLRVQPLTAAQSTAPPHTTINQNPPRQLHVQASRLQLLPQDSHNAGLPTATLGALGRQQDPSSLTNRLVRTDEQLAAISNRVAILDARMHQLQRMSGGDAQYLANGAQPRIVDVGQRMINLGSSSTVRSPVASSAARLATMNPSSRVSEGRLSSGTNPTGAPSAASRTGSDGRTVNRRRSNRTMGSPSAPFTPPQPISGEANPFTNGRSRTASSPNSTMQNSPRAMPLGTARVTAGGNTVRG